MRLNTSLILFSLTLTSVLVSACGPARSTILIIDAQAALDGATTAQADKYALYEYTAAEAYLQKAREEQGYADFEPAMDFAEKAKEMAQKATSKAQSRRRSAQEDSTNATIIIEKDATNDEDSLVPDIKEKR